MRENVQSRAQVNASGRTYRQSRPARPGSATKTRCGLSANDLKLDGFLAVTAGKATIFNIIRRRHPRRRWRSSRRLVFLPYLADLLNSPLGVNPRRNPQTHPSGTWIRRNPLPGNRATGGRRHVTDNLLTGADQKENLSLVYAKTLAARAGDLVSVPEPDRDSIDW